MATVVSARIPAGSRPAAVRPAPGSAAGLTDRIRTRTARVGVVGLGYVGLPLVREFARAGFPVTGFDVDERKVMQLRAGESYIRHIPSALVDDLVNRDRFVPTVDFSLLADMDAVVVCVPTPLTKHREPDLSYVEKTMRTIAATLRPGQLVVLESTTYPGTTREVCLPILSATGLAVGTDFFLAFSPEREDPGRQSHTTKTIPKVVGGIDGTSRDLAAALYATVVDAVVPVSSCDVAEASKILENTYRAVNIALVNELKILFDRMGIDVWEVIDAAKTKPFGFQAFYPGPGFGGHCIPIDPFYLTWKARQYECPTRFVELAGEVNWLMPDYVVSKLADALNDRGKPVRGAKVLVLGLAYKKDVDDVRESPSLVLIEKLRAKGAEVAYNDPYVPATHRQRHFDLKLESTPLTPETLAGFDAVLIATDHSCYDYRMIVDHANLVVDTRNAAANFPAPAGRIVKA